jgi:hypothetical protein
VVVIAGPGQLWLAIEEPAHEGLARLQQEKST